MWGCDLEYPFGLIGTNCSRDDYFAVTCRKPSSLQNKTKAILTKFSLELIEVEVHVVWSSIIGNITEIAHLTVKIPVARACDEVGWRGLNLSGSPFSIDTSQNVFASVGCGGSATLYDKSGWEIRGCSSGCNLPDQLVDGCNGYYCCQSDLRSTKPFQRYTVRVTEGNAATGRSCRAGFLTSRTFLQSNSLVGSAAMDDLAATAVMLLWTSREHSKATPVIH